jgi:DNA-binding transcriptional ArsR family regulator
MTRPLQLQHPIPDPLVELVAQRFKVLAEPMRIKLLDRLREGPATVGALADATRASQQNVSKHLRVLLEAGFVSREQEGNFARYAIADEAVFRLCEEVCGGLHKQLAELEALMAEGTAR